MENNVQKSSPRDVFMYLLATIALYVATFNVVNLLFDYVNVAFPDPLNTWYDGGSSIRWSLALLIIVFPVYLWVSRFLGRDLAVHPEKNEIRIRRWLVYLTLFLAALLIIGDLVALLYNFLEGELTIRFALKIFAVLVAAAAVFWYYLYELRRKPDEFSSKAKWFVWGVTGFIALVVVYGFFVAGSPFKQRLVRFDSQRVSDLQSLKYQIVSYWQAKDRLPTSLDDLRDSISGFVPPRDPQNGASYEYREAGKLSFELCAEFNLASAESRAPSPKFAEPIGQTEEIWDHGAGRTCFSRVIDPDIYGRKDKPSPPIR